MVCEYWALRFGQDAVGHRFAKMLRDIGPATDTQPDQVGVDAVRLGENCLPWFAGIDHELGAASRADFLFESLLHSVAQPLRFCLPVAGRFGRKDMKNGQPTLIFV